MSGAGLIALMAAFQLGSVALTRALLPLARSAAGGFFWGFATLVILVMVALDAAVGSWWMAAGEGIAATVCAVMWWLSRRKRKDRARKWLGAKSKALRDALVRKARELSVPRPVLAPGGAR